MRKGRRRAQYVHVPRTVGERVEVRAEHGAALADRHVERDPCRFFWTLSRGCGRLAGSRSVVCYPKVHERAKGGEGYVHQARIAPSIAYVPLVTQKVAKYRTWLLVATVRSSLLGR